MFRDILTALDKLVEDLKPFVDTRTAQLVAEVIDAIELLTVEAPAVLSSSDSTFIRAKIDDLRTKNLALTRLVRNS